MCLLSPLNQPTDSLTLRCVGETVQASLGKGKASLWIKERMRVIGLLKLIQSTPGSRQLLLLSRLKNMVKKVFPQTTLRQIFPFISTAASCHFQKAPSKVWPGRTVQYL